MQRIEAFDQRLRLNSVRALAPDAMDAAARLDGLLGQILANASSAGAPSQPQLPPLFCVPLLVKDNFDVVGLATTAGAHADFGADAPLPPCVTRQAAGRGPRGCSEPGTSLLTTTASSRWQPPLPPPSA